MGASEPIKPRLRGVLHHYACFGSLIAGVVLVLAAPGPLAKAATGVYALALSGVFTVSALYHRIDWRPSARRWMRRLDHSMIFVLIAGTYTPFALLVLERPVATLVLVAGWVGALLGIVLKLAWLDSPRWFTALICLALGWVGLATAPELARAAGVGAIAVIVGGGLLYTVGAVVYALHRPDPVPATFGYHEVFHMLVIAAAALHFASIAVYALPAG